MLPGALAFFLLNANGGCGCRVMGICVRQKGIRYKGIGNKEQGAF